MRMMRMRYKVSLDANEIYNERIARYAQFITYAQYHVFYEAKASQFVAVTRLYSSYLAFWIFLHDNSIMET